MRNEVVTGEEMALYDRYTMEELGVPGMILMEQAALAVTEEIVNLFPGRGEGILILAGKGNNGADGLAAARLLLQRGYDVTVYPALGLPEKEGPGSLFSLQYGMLLKMKAPIVTELPEASYPMVVDALFGVGLNRELTGKAARIIRRINGWDSFVLAVDAPSGLDCNTGRLMGPCIKADCTVTFGFLKLGLCLYPGAAFAGRVAVKEIGVTRQSFAARKPGWFTFLEEPLALMPPRKPQGHKGDFGKVLVVAGSESTGGAAYLSALGALRSGCGMVRICTHRNQQTALTGLLPEALLDVYDTPKDGDDESGAVPAAYRACHVLKKGLQWADVVIFGPGVGMSPRAKAMLGKALADTSLPLVLDADGLNLLADSELAEGLAALQQREESRRALIFTPHPLELARLSHSTVEEAQDRRKRIAEEVSAAYEAVVVQKDARTLVIKPGGNGYINLSGNSGMATAGSGDVLTGMIASLLAQGAEDAFSAACLGVYLHGKAGDLAASLRNPYSLTASDIGAALGPLLAAKDRPLRTGG